MRIVSHPTRPGVIPGALLLDREVSDRAVRLYGIAESRGDNEHGVSYHAASLLLGCTVAEVEAAVAELTPRWLGVGG